MNNVFELVGIIVISICVGGLIAVLLSFIDFSTYIGYFVVLFSFIAFLILFYINRKE